MDKNHIVFIVMDSCRYDTRVAACTPNIDRIGQAERRYSYASWTAPSHDPYMLSGDSLPHISGMHGALKSMGDGVGGPHRIDESFDLEQLKGLHQQQVKCVEYIDGVLGKLMQKAPANTHFIVTADHGELFGEDGYFDHGPIMHGKCFEIRYVEGKVKEATA